ncbi:MAG: helix-turn-helix transcriptional regulator [Gammaproteobacteria bacterium]|nr:helix-turn-helix transcriptional regulator [Gammaproteobacteria bacterium]
MPDQLGAKLRRLRQNKGVSLRTVESETGISNAYLSQLERGVATNPNPIKLRKLAEYFNAPYLDLLAHAGYLPSGARENYQGLIANSVGSSRKESQLSSSIVDLTNDEENLVLQYIEFLKSRRN